MDVGPSLQALIESTDLSGVTISPDGRYASVRTETPSIEANTVRLKWFFASLANGQTTFVGSGGDPEWIPSGVLLPEIPVWSKDSKWLYFKALNSSELAVWRTDLDGHAEKLISGPSDIEDFQMDDSGRQIFYTVGPPRSTLEAAGLQEEMGGVRLDGTQYIGAPLEGNMPYRGGMSTVRLKSYGWLRIGDDGARSVNVFDLATGASHAANVGERATYEDMVRRKSTALNHEKVSSVARSGDGASFAYISHDDPRATDEFGQNASSLALYLSDMTSTRPRKCRERACALLTGQVVWRPQSHEFVFTSLDAEGGVGMYAWDAVGLGMRRVFFTKGILAANPNTEIPSAQCPVTHDFAVCVIERALEPPTLVRIDLKDGSLKVLFDPNASLRMILPDTVEHLSWPDERGFSHTGVLLLPEGKRANSKVPLIITSYECTGFLRGGTGATVPEFVLAQFGFGVLCVNTNGPTTGREYAPEYRSGKVPAGKATMLQHVLDGWRSAVDSLASKGVIDKSRVGVSGLSFTGEAVDYALTHSRFAAAATSGHFAILDPNDYYITSGMGETGRAMIRMLPLPDPQTKQGQEHYKLTSPAVNAGRLSCPLLIQTDESEFVWGLQTYGALRQTRKPLDVFVFPKESHIFWQPRHRLVMNQRNIDWFRFWLQNYEDSNVAKRDQYVRWENLRAERDARKNATSDR